MTLTLYSGVYPTDSATTTTDQRRQVLHALRHGPLIDQEIEAVTGLTGNSLRFRRHELIKAGKMQTYPGKRKTRAGRPAQLWAVCK